MTMQNWLADGPYCAADVQALLGFADVPAEEQPPPASSTSAARREDGSASAQPAAKRTFLNCKFENAFILQNCHNSLRMIH